MKKDYSKNISELVFDEDREMFPDEYMNLREKQKDGYFNVDFFRNTVFNPTCRGKREKYITPKVIWENRDKTISVSHNLHQKHADILSILFADNFGVSKPSKDGSFLIYTSLYHIAKKMGYANPSSSANKIKSFLTDMRHTDFIVKQGEEVITDTILGKSYYHEGKETFMIKVMGDSAKILAHSTGIKIEKKLNEKIVNIPDKYAKIKAIIRYILSNKCTEYGFTLEFFFTKFSIGQVGKTASRQQAKSKLKKLLRDTEDNLSQFNIRYCVEKEKLFYQEKLDDISFKLPINTQKVADKILKQEEPHDEYSHYIGKKFKLNDIIFEVISITNINKENNTADIKMLNTSIGLIGVSKNASLSNLDRYISEFLY